MTEKTHYQILIIGGGTGGLTVAARLKNENASFNVGLIEPSEKHYYQPLWTLVGGGVFTKESTERNEADYMPEGVDWIKDYAETFLPEENKLVLKSGKTLTYDYLVVSPGIQLDWNKVKGLQETMGKNGVCSNYSYDTVDSTWKFAQEFKGGTAIFTQPSTPIKCGGAPQKALYLIEDYFRTKSKVRNNAKVLFRSGLMSIFGVEKYKKSLLKVLKRKEIEASFREDLIEVRGDKQEAVFKNLDTNQETVIKFDFLHVVPPMSAPDFIKKSPLVDEAGWLSINKNTLQSTKYSNIFALGDCTNAPTARTGAAVRKQAPVLVQNLMLVMDKREPQPDYDGYSSCPLVTGYGSLILAEFDYNNNPSESFPFDQSQERFSMYMLKAYVLPQMYWNGMLRGRM